MALGSLVVSSLRAQENRVPELNAVCSRMVAMDKWRTETLLGYSVTRRYTLQYGGSADSAEMLVELEYSHPGHKIFKVLSAKNAGLMQEHIFRRAMDAEVQADRDDIRDSTRILPRNYDFAVLGSEDVKGRAAYLIKMKPKRKQRFSVDGRIWVDMKDAAVARIDGEVATKSFWVRRFHLVQSYQRIGPYWLAASTRNHAHVRFFGEAQLNIENFDYKLRPA